MKKEDLVKVMQASAAEAERPRPVEVPGWGKLFVREITVAEAEEQADDISDQKNKNRIARAAARVICDETGKRLFDPENEEDVKLLASQPWSMLRKVLPTFTDTEGGKAKK